MPENTSVPNGFESIDFPECDLGVCGFMKKKMKYIVWKDNAVKGLKKKVLQLITAGVSSDMFAPGSPRRTKRAMLFLTSAFI